MDTVVAIASLLFSLVGNIASLVLDYSRLRGSAAALFVVCILGALLFPAAMGFATAKPETALEYKVMYSLLGALWVAAIVIIQWIAFHLKGIKEDADTSSRVRELFKARDNG